ncbi:MAG TPA: protein kinase [Bryobacteraceae bacterium]
MSVPRKIKGRYEIRQVLGQGGMGVVYHAFDSVVKRSVALKTVRDSPSRSALDLFYKESAVLASMSHPNIVEIFDLGEFEDEGATRPYFVMPLLPGSTLAALIAAKSGRLNVERVVDILCQACRGLQAAHEHGLIHRDLKPSNIFVLDDDSVKIIDFGIARAVDGHSTAGQKGTLLYMSPEQVDLQAPTPLSDIFAAGVVAYEAMTLRHPFERGSAAQVAAAIKAHIPPPASELNPLVNAAIGRVIHKAMAKQPWHRFGSARELSEALQKAAHNEFLEIFNPARIQPALERARKAFQQGDYPFADEILSELEVQGHADEEISSLRRCLSDAQRSKTVGYLMDSAHTRAEQQEFALALQKLQELLALEPSHAAALELKKSIETKRLGQQVEEWFRLAQQHIQQKTFQHARQALQNVLRLRPNDPQAVKLLAEVDRGEQEYARLHQEQDQLYSNAMECWQKGDISAALSRLERLVALGITSDERSATFQKFYNQVRSEQDAVKSAYEQARKHLADGNFDEALRICEQQQASHPGQALIQSLKFDIEEQRCQDLSRRIAEIDRRVDQEADLDMRVGILAEAVERHPSEAHFERALRTAREKRDLVNSIVAKARGYEDRAHYADALGQWEIVRTIYPQYRGLDFEVERVRHRHEHQLRSDAKAKWVERIDWKITAADYGGAVELARCALAEFPEDPELLELVKLADQELSRAEEAQRLLSQAEELRGQQRFAEAAQLLRSAHEADSGNAQIRAALAGALAAEARASVNSDWRTAGALIEEALRFDPENREAKSLCALVADRERDEAVNQCATRARRLQAEGQVEPAIREVQQALEQYPMDARLLQLRVSLIRALPEETLPPTKSLSMPSPDNAAAPTIDLPPPEPVSQRGSNPPSPRPKKNLLFPATAAAAVVILAAAGLFQVIGPKPPRPAQPAPVRPGLVVVPPPPAAEPPAKTTVMVYADIAAGRVVLDDLPMGELRDGQLKLENLTPGAHSLKVGAYREQVTVNFEVADGKAPAVQSVLAKEASAMAVASLGDRARVHSDLENAPVALDGAAVGAGGEITGIAPGIHTLELGEGSARHTATWSLEQGPALSVFLKSNRNAGTLVVVTGESGARVWLNGREQRAKTKDGRLRIEGLDVARYSVRVGKDGFQDAPEQQANVRKGEDTTLEFRLRPVPQAASLSVSGGVPGAEVLLDQASLGFVRDDGGFNSSGITPGDHSIEFRKQSYRPRKAEKHFDANSVIQLSAAEAALEKAPGTIRFSVTPADAEVTISRAGSPPERVSIGSIQEPEGTYTLTARRAPDYLERSSTFSIGPGEEKVITLALERAPAQPKPVDVMSQWDNPSAWSLVDTWYVRKGGNFAGYKPAVTSGTFVFRIRLDRGRRLQWVAAWRDNQNYLLFQMDKKSFSHLRVVNGKEGPVKKSPHNLEKEATYSLQIEISDDAIIHRFVDGSRQIVLDEWREPGAKFTAGRFGFLVPGSDTIAVKDFHFTPK